LIVVDASALLELLLRTEAAPKVEKRLFSAGQTLHVPHLIDLEIAQVVRRYCTLGDFSVKRGNEVLQDLIALPLNRYPHDIFLPRIWELRNSVTAYDAVYIALAEVLPAPLLTRDARLASAHGHRATIDLI
jgi:predicted nucleic acid-binding protein